MNYAVVDGPGVSPVVVDVIACLSTAVVVEDLSIS